MASRTSAGIGMTITVTIFIVLTMVFLFASVFLYSEKSNAEGRVRELTNTYEEVIKTGERQSSNVQVALGAARAERKSLVDYLLSNNAELNRVAFGNAALTIEQARDRADGLARGNASLAATITRLEGDVQSLTSERDSAIAQMRSNEADLNAEFERIRQIEASAMATAAEATDRVDEYAREVEALKARVEAFETRTSRTVDDDRQQYGADLRDRDQRIAELNQDILVLRDQVRRLRGETTDNRVTPLDEYALVDGEVAAVQPGDMSWSSPWAVRTSSSSA
jgi:DNA repair exonuclease SbcCD ATPase subunit